MAFAKVYRLSASQVVPRSLPECWEYFSDPRNLATITPPWLRFEMMTPPPANVYAGLILEYRVAPVLGIPLRWLTEITHVAAPHFFVDEQRFGPYRFWHHQHHFRSVEDGTQIQDVVHYALPFGPLGRIVRRLVVARQLREIFEYRRAALTDLFGSHAVTSEAQAVTLDSGLEDLPSDGRGTRA